MPSSIDAPLPSKVLVMTIAPAAAAMFRGAVDGAVVHDDDFRHAGMAVGERDHVGRLCRIRSGRG